MPLYTGDYLRDTRHLTPMRHGVYLLLLMHCWDSKGPAPLDEQECGGIANCRSADEIDALRYVLERYFVRMNDGWYSARMQKEIERSEVISAKRAVAGLARHGMAAPVNVRPGQRLRTARISAARRIATHTDVEWQSMVEFHGDKCAKCGSEETMMVKDHIVSLHAGGSDGIENLQPLCYRCNHAKGGAGREDYRANGWREHVSASADQVLASADQVLASATTPTPTTTTTTTPTTTIKSSSKPRKIKSVDAEQKTLAVLPAEFSLAEASAKNEKPSSGTATWTAYANAYFARYGSEPVRNGKGNKLACDLVKRLGAEEAPLVAAFFLGHNGEYYLRRGHDFGALVHDAEKLRTEWATGRTMTAAKARDVDRRQTVVDAVEEAKLEMARRRNGT